MDRIVVVGASLAGVRAAEALRRGGYDGTLTIVGDETHFPPYDRPPLSKELLSGEWDLDRGRLRVEPDTATDLRLGVTATALDLRGSVALDDGGEVEFDGLVVATGASPRVPPSIDQSLLGIHVIRTIEDTVALRRALERRPRVVVVGGGFIGAEVAAVCRGKDLDVTVVEPLSVPMERALGPVLGAWAAGLHRAHGVDLRLSVGVASVVGTARAEAVLLTDGDEIPADVVVVAVGAAPATRWLASSGLIVDDGVVCDETCRALGTANVVAAGDVCRWRNPMFDRTMRVEHWANAVEQAEAAARTLLSGPEDAVAFSSVPYFWSNQYDTKIQYVGIAGAFAGVVEGALDQAKFVAVFADGERLVGALCVNSPARMPRYRRLIVGGATTADLEGARAEPGATGAA